MKVITLASSGMQTYDRAARRRIANSMSKTCLQGCGEWYFKLQRTPSERTH